MKRYYTTYEAADGKFFESSIMADNDNEARLRARLRGLGETVAEDHLPISQTNLEQDTENFDGFRHYCVHALSIAICSSPTLCMKITKDCGGFHELFHRNEPKGNYETTLKDLKILFNVAYLPMPKNIDEIIKLIYT